MKKRRPGKCKVCHQKIHMMIYRYTAYCSQRCELAAKEEHLAAVEANYEAWRNK